MKDLLIYGIIFIVMYLCYVLFVICRKKKLEKFRNNTYVKYLEKVYQLDLKKADLKILAHVIALANAFIITVTLYCIGVTNNLIYKMLLAIAILIPFQLLIYHIMGKIYQRKYKIGRGK